MSAGDRRRVGLFGGSFDPIHRGHLDPVRAAAESLALDRVVYLPTARPPHKPKREFAPALARFAMVELALLGEPGFAASGHELTLGRPAYTVETVEHFAAELPEADLHLLIGSDSFAELPTWKRWRELVAAVELVVLVRPGWEMEEIRGGLPPELEERLASGHVHVVSDESVDLSSTELRRTLAAGEEPPAGALEPLVLNYIRKYDLYR
ncbi:MAG TPA: nicotinate-nucleotide adenylyltransferase [Thermoanaerobaculia bacterium]|nr:nicotinate-nucleotide adenylyltransferase [Thermoanaerobaculia bacterium]